MQKEAAYDMMKPEEQCLFRLQCWLALCNEMIGNGENGMLLASMDPVNNCFGPSAITDVEQGIFIENLNVTAGNKAISMSDLTHEFKLFDDGISFLQKQLLERSCSCLRKQTIIFLQLVT